MYSVATLTLDDEGDDESNAWLFFYLYSFPSQIVQRRPKTYDGVTSYIGLPHIHIDASDARSYHVFDWCSQRGVSHVRQVRHVESNTGMASSPIHVPGTWQRYLGIEPNFSDTFYRDVARNWYTYSTVPGTTLVVVRTAK